MVLSFLMVYVGTGAQSLASNGLPAHKDAYEARYAQERNAPKAPKGDPATARPAFMPDSLWPTGVFEEGQAPFSASVLTVKNQWQGVSNGHYVQVYAGVLPSDPSQGVLVVVKTSFDLEPLGSQWVSTPVKSGAARIVTAEGDRLIVITEGGDTRTFDVNSRTFVK